LTNSTCNSPDKSLRVDCSGRKYHYSETDDLSESGKDKRLARMEASVAEMKEKFDFDQLCAEAKVSHELWEYRYEIERGEVKFCRMHYVYNQMRHTRSFPTC
jgi:hypothetical protein